MTGLNIAPDVQLPLEAVTETFVVLAKRGSGKTYTACVMCEEMIKAGQVCVVIDPIGVWWGLRASADAKGPGLPVVIFGGDHADLPLDEHSGEIIADAIVAERFSAILDLSHLSKTKARTFMTAFLERLYHRNRDPLHIFIDEADAFAPQRAADGGQRLLGAMEDLVRRGRARGIGSTLITQRPAVLHKDVLSQAEVLICLRMTGVRDVAAIDEWIKLHDVDDQAAELKKSLPSLPVGTAWIWSPGWLERLDRVKIRTRTTFDSSATPKIGQTRVVPKQMADIDLDALGAKIASTAEEVKANDPKALKAEVARLKRELDKAQVVPAPVVEQVEVSVLTDDDRETLHGFGVTTAEAIGGFEAIADLLRRISASAGAPQRPAPRAVARERFVPHRAEDRPKPARQAASGPGVSLPGPQRKILTALAQHGPKEKTSLAILTGYSHKGGGFNNPVGSLRAAGYITPAGVTPIAITDEGIEALGDYEPLPTGRELLEWWLPQLTGPERKIVSALDEYGPMEKVDLAAATGYEPKGGGFNNPMGHLRTLGIITAAGVSPIGLAPEMAEGDL